MAAAPLAVYLASAQELETLGGDAVAVGLAMADEGAQLHGLVATRFRSALMSLPSGARIISVLREHGTLEHEPGTAPLAALLERTANDVGRSVRHVVLASGSDAARFYDAFEDRVDRWLEDDEVTTLSVYLAGDSTVDVLAAISCLHGSRQPQAIEVHRWTESAMGEGRFERLDLGRRIGEELTREHARQRIDAWEFEEVRGLARAHPRDFADAAELLDATGRYLQRDPSLLDRPDVDDGDIPVVWEHTRAFCHALELAEYYATLGRAEEELAWYVSLAFLELAPMAWAERWTAEVLGEQLRLAEALDAVEARWPDIWHAPGALARVDRRQRSEDAKEALALMLAVGPPALQLDGRVLMRGRTSADAGGRTPPEDHVAAVVWAGLGEGLGDLRNTLAHGFHDLTRDSLLAALEHAASTAATHASSLLDVDAEDVAGHEDRHERRLAIIGDRPVKWPLGGARWSGGAKRVRAQLREHDKRGQVPDEVRATLRRWVMVLDDVDDVVLHELVLMLAATDASLAERLREEVRSLEPAAWTQQDHDRTRVVVHRVLDARALIPTSLAEDVAKNLLWEVAGVFSPRASRRVNPLRTVRRALLDELGSPTHRDD